MKLGITNQGFRRLGQEDEPECPFQEPDGLSYFPFKDGKGWHWTDRASAEKIMREGLGTRSWTTGEHHAGYMYCELPEEQRRKIDEKYGHPSEWTRDLPYGSGWYDEVEELLREAYPEIHMSCLGTDPYSSESYGEVAIIVDMEEVAGVIDGFMFSDTAFGYCLLTWGKIPPEALTFHDPEIEGATR